MLKSSVVFSLMAAVALDAAAITYSYRQAVPGLAPTAAVEATPPAAAGCPLPWGGTLLSGASVLANNAATVPYGSACLVETRACSNGVLSGSYSSQSCVVAASPVGDGTSVNGACADGSAPASCVVWDPTGLSSAIGVSTSKLTVNVTASCYGSLACTARTTKAVSAGKWYWELTLDKITTGYGGLMLGTVQEGTKLDTPNSVYYYAYSNGVAYKGSSQLPLSNGGHANGDTYGFALDMDNRTIAVTHNGMPVFSTTLPAGMTSVNPAVGENWFLAPHAVTANFGQSTFRFPVPSGFNRGLW